MLRGSDDGHIIWRMHACTQARTHAQDAYVHTRAHASAHISMSIPGAITCRVTWAWRTHRSSDARATHAHTPHLGQEQKEQLSKADRRKKIQEHLRKRKEAAVAADPATVNATPSPPKRTALRKARGEGGKGKSPGGRGLGEESGELGRAGGRGRAGGGGGGARGLGGGRSQEIDLLRDDYGIVRGCCILWRHLSAAPTTRCSAAL